MFYTFLLIRFGFFRAAKGAAAMLLSCLLIKATAQNAGSNSLQAGLIDTGIVPKLFAPGIISTPFQEWSTSFTPDGNTVYSSQGGLYWTIVYAKRKNGNWTAPEVAGFSGRYRDTDPFVTPDGKRIFFISNRPAKGEAKDKPSRVTSIWYIDLLAEDKWGEPQQLDSGINLPGESNYAPSVSANGTLFFCGRRNGKPEMLGFYCKKSGDHYGRPQRLLVSGSDEVQDPFIAPDERYLVFLNGNDIFISYKKDGAWTQALNLGPVVNNGDGNSSPYISRDGSTLYYSSARVKGLYKRDYNAAPINYDQLKRENQGCFNGNGNILMVPIHLARG